MNLNSEPTTPLLKDRIRDFLPGSSFGTVANNGSESKKATEADRQITDSNRIVWNLPVHQNLLSLQTKLHENDPTRLAVLCSTHWDQVDALDEETRKREVLATAETVRHARRRPTTVRAYPKQQTHVANASQRSHTDPPPSVEGSSVPGPSTNHRSTASAHVRARRATMTMANGVSSGAPTSSSSTARDEPPPFSHHLDQPQGLQHPVGPSPS